MKEFFANYGNAYNKFVSGLTFSIKFNVGDIL